MKTIRHYENLHIPLWLIKDTCWMMEFKVLGVCMIAPTLIVALILLINLSSINIFLSDRL